MEELMMNNTMEQNEGMVAPVVEQQPVLTEVPVAKIRLTKGEKIAVGACIGGAALAVVEAGVIVFLIRRNGGIKAAFSKKDADDFDEDDFESYEEFEDDDEDEVSDEEDEVKDDKKK